MGTVQIYFLIKQKVITKYNDEFTKIRHFAVLKTIQKTYYHNLLKKYLIGFEDIANDAYVKKVLSRYIIVNDNIIKRNKK